MKSKSEERRNHILVTADAVFREMGFEAASMSIIAARVGGSKATLYNYFSTKEELFVEIMLESAQKQGKEAFDILDRPMPIDLKLEKFSHGYLKFITSGKMTDMRRMAVAQAQRSNIGAQCYERGMKKGWGRVADTLAAAMGENVLRKADPWQAAMHLKGLLETGIVDLCLLGVKVDLSARRLRKAVQLALDIFFKGYAPQ